MLEKLNKIIEFFSSVIFSEMDILISPQSNASKIGMEGKEIGNL